MTQNKITRRFTRNRLTSLLACQNVFKYSRSGKKIKVHVEIKINSQSKHKSIHFWTTQATHQKKSPTSHNAFKMPTEKKYIKKTNKQGFLLSIEILTAA